MLLDAVQERASAIYQLLALQAPIPARVVANAQVAISRDYQPMGLLRAILLPPYMLAPQPLAQGP